MHFARTLPHSHANLKTLFCTSMTNLAELIALRPDLRAAHKVLYFHENEVAAVYASVYMCA